MLLSTPKQARKRVQKIREEMNEHLVKKQEHDLRKSQPAQLSLVDHMNTRGLLSHWTSRREMAEKFGIRNYAGTSEQNARFLAILQNNANVNTNKF